MTNLRHVVLSRSDLVGFQFGMLRDLTDEIVRVTGATSVPMAVRSLPAALHRRVGHGMRLQGMRALIPPTRLEVAPEADVLWVPLMTPEEFSLDLYKGWDRGARKKILYLFDTFESHLPALRRIVASTRWDAAITAFSGAVPFLERETGIRWSAVEQGVKVDRFPHVAESERVIAMSAYGRRHERFHAAAMRWTARRGLHYDYTVAATVQASIDPREIYRQYAWHVAHSVFTFAWPVETTTPGRARGFSPITCRWFEAACAGTVMIGQPPRDPGFHELLEDAVVKLDPEASPEDQLDAVWERRHELLAHATALRMRRLDDWTWEARIRQMLGLIDVAA